MWHSSLPAGWVTFRNATSARSGDRLSGVGGQRPRREQGLRHKTHGITRMNADMSSASPLDSPPTKRSPLNPSHRQCSGSASLNTTNVILSRIQHKLHSQLVSGLKKKKNAQLTFLLGMLCYRNLIPAREDGRVHAAPCKRRTVTTYRINTKHLP